MDVRLDKWLWAARFYKTRSIARQAIDGGKVHYNNQRSKPSKVVEVGAMIKVRQGFDEKIIEVIALSDQRRGASEAQRLYQETAESIEKREAMRLQRKTQASHAPVEGRPNKKQRRDIIRFKQQDVE